MFLTPNSNFCTQWTESQQVLEELHQIAHQSITAPPQRRDQLQASFIALIYQQDFDSLYGGLIIQKESMTDNQPSVVFYKPIIANLFIAELLLTADQVFYHGELSFVGKQALQNVISLISQPNQSLLQYQEYFLKSELACFFNKETLEQRLTARDKQLLLALTSNVDSSTDGEDNLMCYKLSIREAAENIGMHYKEAQIIENNIRLKLTNKQIQKASKNLEQLSNVIEINCQFIITLGRYLTNQYDEDNWLLAKQLFQTIDDKINTTNHTRNDLINLIYSGIVLLQVNFDLELLDTIKRLLQQINNLPQIPKNDEKMIQQESFIAVFIEELIKRNMLSENLSGLFSVTEKYHPKVIFLSKIQTDLDIQRMELRSKYHAYRLVYVI